MLISEPEVNDSPKRSSLDASATLICWLIIAVAALVPFTALSSNSLWMDELFSVYFTDPTLSFRAMFLRALEDGHPPGFYLLAFLARNLLPLDPELIGRGLSAVFGVLALLVIWHGTRRLLSPAAAAFMLASGALSVPYFMVSVEFRSYALCLLVVAVWIWLTIRVLRVYDGQLQKAVPYGAVLAATLTGAFVHSYLVLVAGALYAYLILASPNLRNRLIWAALGTCVALFALAFNQWQKAHIVADLSKTWFNYFNPIATLPDGLRLALNSYLALATMLLSPILLTSKPAVRSPVWLCVLVILGSTALGIAYSLVVMNMMSFRFFIPLMPFLWLLTGLVVEKWNETRWRGPVHALFLVAALASSVRIVERWQQVNADWRGTARIVDRLCPTGSVLVAGNNQPYIRGDEARVFYGHYLKGDAELRIIPKTATAQQVASRAVQSNCPVLLWSVENMPHSQITKVAKAIDTVLPNGCRVEVQQVTSYDFADVFELPFSSRETTGQDNAFVLLRQCGAAGAV
jgi:uncharacterized membrane protein